MDSALGAVNMCAVRKGDEMRVEPRPLPQIPADLKALFDATPDPVKENVG